MPIFKLHVSGSPLSALTPQGCRARIRHRGLQEWGRPGRWAEGADLRPPAARDHPVPRHTKPASAASSGRRAACAFASATAGELPLRRCPCNASISRVAGASGTGATLDHRPGSHPDQRGGKPEQLVSRSRLGDRQGGERPGRASLALLALDLRAQTAQVRLLVARRRYHYGPIATANTCIAATPPTPLLTSGSVTSATVLPACRGTEPK